MSWLAPMWLAGAAAAAGMVVLLHFLARRRPTEQLFPTTRFVPVAPARATTRAVRPTDLLLLAMRVLLIMLIGAAFARPVLTPERRPRASVILADQSRAVRDIAEVERAVAGARAEGDVVIAFDSAAHRVPGARDSAVALTASTARGSLSAALIAGFRVADSLRAFADTVDVLLVSPLVREEIDEATGSIRALWPGPIRLAAVSPANTRAPTGVEVSASQGDAVRAGVALSGLLQSAASARVIREAPSEADLAWARAGNVLVHWPRVLTGADTQPALVWRADQPEMTPGPFLRRELPAGGMPIAYWIDGEVAATEVNLGNGCIREVAADPGVAGDVVLRPSFGRLVAWLAASCGHPDFAAVADSVRISLSESPEKPVVSAKLPATRESPLSRWLFLGAAIMAGLEPLARRRKRRGAD